ncbi:Kinesin family protein [Penicillium digitatum]|nr:Kinesin family protein [Penicillium digitatum]
MRTSRSTSRLSMSSRQGGSRASDEDGKTAVKVAVRVRPPLKPTDPGYELIPQRFQKSTVQVTAPTSLAVDVSAGRKLFVFDRVFPETTEQEGIWEYVSDSVDSFVEGYNVSIMAYGQSGAGKSFTMGTSGPIGQHNMHDMGIIPRAAQVLFDKLDGPSKHNRNSSHSNSGLRTPQRYSLSSAANFGKLNQEKEKTWQLKATYVEIYNEHLRDLLLPESTIANDRSNVTIREDTKGRIILTGLHQVNVNSFEDLIGALNFGSTIRQTDSTAINAKSSRSHAVFSLNLVQRKSSSNHATPSPMKEKRMSIPSDTFHAGESVTVDSKLHFVDLAGSERLKNTGASGERAREGISINAGLAALGKVISQLSSRQQGSHVSYRDSKLTRLLQDSLGGNAYTYMIACVTPAEFHLSETLNTISYAQRARAIQSKPHIQQIADDGDKQALIERLKSEISFLRLQIHNSEGSERREGGSTERSERKNDREKHLQNQLLDIQENYNSLSQRHAKLISNMANDSHSHTTNGDLDDATSEIGKNSVERMQRSKSFAESVEQMVLEYEKTIQSLESSLSETRASLSITESDLLERETKCAYIETIKEQLQTRVQKLTDRELSTENYLHELESKLDGHSTGEEKHAAIVAELRKELSRARESEASCEEYISTLEERLAESDQDMELMQREVVRLEHVIERQRGLGQLDRLLGEMDQPDGGDRHNGASGINYSHYHQPRGMHPSHRHAPSLDVLNEAVETAIPESDEDSVEPTVEAELESIGESERETGEDLKVLESVTSRLGKLEARRSEALHEEPLASPAQSKFVADKLETITQELFDLRLQHENTIGNYENLESKYEQALKALEELRQDKIDEARHPAPDVQNELSPRPATFLGNGGTPTSKAGPQHSSSQSLSSELSSVGEQSTLRALSEDGSKAVSSAPSTPQVLSVANADSEEFENMRKMLAEHQESAELMAEKYNELQNEHDQILLLVERLKVEAHRAKSNSPPATPGFKMLRRMTSQNILSGVDRATRALTGLRLLASEEFAGKPDAMLNFDYHLDQTMHELQSRMERLQSLEAENQSVKKEMEMKATIISGLTRERSSLQGSSPVDMALVSQLRDQVISQEIQINRLRDAHESRQKELLNEINSLKGLLKSQESATRAMDAGAEKQDKNIDALRGELREWKGKHKSALQSLQSSESQLTTTLAELESALALVAAMRSERAATDADSTGKEGAAREIEGGRAEQQALVDSLMKNIEDHKSTIATQLATIATLERSRSDARDQLTLQTTVQEGTNASAVDLDMSSRMAELEQLISTHKSVVDSHKHELDTLQKSHKRELVELEERTKAAAQAECDARLAKKDAEHEQSMATLQNEIAESRDELVKLLKAVSTLLNTEVSAENLTDQIQNVLAQKQHFSDKYAELMGTNEDLRKQLDANADSESRLDELTKKNNIQDAKVNELALLVATLEDTLRMKEEQIKKKEALIEEITVEKQKSVRLVEELEEQITNSFDQHHNRLSIIQQERDQALEDAKAKIVIYEGDIETYQVRIEQLELQIKNTGNSDGSHDRTGSPTSNLRKSSSAATLPSPPPAIPLPPLPTIASHPNGTSSVSPPNSRHASKELSNAQMVEDQEARIRTIEKHLYAEKQLTATLEEALGDLEAQSTKIKSDCEAWKKKAWSFEDELNSLRKERNSARLSLQAVEEERSARREAEAARAQLEERMLALNKKKKKSSLNCF